MLARASSSAPTAPSAIRACATTENMDFRAEVATPGGFPDSAVYISESGGDDRVPHSYGARIEISGNMFTDNWGGVVLWENADRYCVSGADTSTGYCTLVDPSVATITNCSNSHLI